MQRDPREGGLLVTQALRVGSDLLAQTFDARRMQPGVERQPTETDVAIPARGGG